MSRCYAESVAFKALDTKESTISIAGMSNALKSNAQDVEYYSSKMTDQREDWNGNIIKNFLIEKDC